MNVNKRPNEYSDDEIYKSLIPKMVKAGYLSSTETHLDTEVPLVAIALAYRSGYLRAQKGRSFIIGEKKPTAEVIE